ncbi:hypothetical protein Aperf_G00000008242 [Anoplocephala perfoliata]
MFGKPKTFTSPSDAQANEKLAFYVYEYLVYCGAQKAAQIFLQEIGLEKHVVPNEAPGFLFSWWSVFWDLYCAAPERRDVFKHSPDARAFYDYGLASLGFVPSGPQLAPMGSLGAHYVNSRNGPPPPMLQHQQYMSQPRQMYPPGISRPNEVKMAGLVPMSSEQQVETFFSSPTSAFRLNSNIPTLPIASAPTVTLRHQPRPPIGPRGSVPVMTNGNAGGVGSLNPSSAPSFSGSPPNGIDFQPQQQFGRPTFQQQRSLPLKMSPCPSNGMQPPQWGPSISQTMDFLGNPHPSNKLSPDAGGAMLFDPSMMDPMGPCHSVPQQQQSQVPPQSAGSGGETFTFFEQADGLPSSSMDESGQAVQPQQQQQLPIPSQISQLLSPSPIQQNSRSDAPRSSKPVGGNIEDALLLSAPELDLLTGTGDPVEGSDQPLNGPSHLPSGQVFDSEQIKGEDGSTMLFPGSDDFRTVQNIVDAMQDPISGSEVGGNGELQKQSFCPLKDMESTASAALFLQE